MLIPGRDHLGIAISDAAFAIVPGGETDAVTGLPVSGPIRDLLDAQAIVVLDETGAPVSGAGAITLGTCKLWPRRRQWHSSPHRQLDMR